MQNERKKLSRGLIIALAIPYILFLVFFICLLVFGAMATKCADPDLKGGLGDVFKYHFSDMGGLFSFNFHEGSNVVYFGLSGLLYFFIFIAILYLIVGIWVIYKKKRLIVIPAIAASLLVIFVFMMVATGLPKYWAIINNRSPFDTKNNLVGATFAILIFGVLYVLAAYISYFASLVAAYKNPGVFEAKKASANDDDAVEFEEYIPEPEPEPEPERFPHGKSAPVQEEKAPEDKSDLKSLLKEVVRDIVRDEIARNNANQPKSDFNAASGGSVTGATFGGPLVVQYFNGGIQGAAPVSQPAPEPVKEEKKEEPKQVEEEPVQEPEPEPQPEPVEEAPVVEEPAPEPVVEEPQPEPVVEEVVVPVEEPAPEPVVEEKKPIIRIPFTERMLNADKEMQSNYNELKNEILSYGVNSRVSNSGDTFRLHRKTYVKITIAGLSLKLYFALNPDDYKDSTLPIQNAGHKGIYEEIPLVFKVKSGLSMRRCKQLIQDVFDKNGLEQGEIGNTNWVEELKNIQAEDDKDED